MCASLNRVQCSAGEQPSQTATADFEGCGLEANGQEPTQAVDSTLHTRLPTLSGAAATPPRLSSPHSSHSHRGEPLVVPLLDTACEDLPTLQVDTVASSQQLNGKDELASPKVSAPAAAAAAADSRSGRTAGHFHSIQERSHSSSDDEAGVQASSAHNAAAAIAQVGPRPLRSPFSACADT